MKIGIDISQIVYEGTGVSTFVRRMVDTLLTIDKKNQYVLFASTLRKGDVIRKFVNNRAPLTLISLPPSILSFLWNTLHIVPVETFTGPLDVFWSSDWTQPPLRSAVGVTTIHDLTPIKFPSEMDTTITKTHKKRLSWVKKECKAVFCDSQATKDDVIALLGIPKERLHVVYPGI